MGKSSNGPDAIDVIAMMMAIGTMHDGRVGVALSLAGTGFTPSVQVSCIATFDIVPGSALPADVVVSSAWPCPEHQDFLAHVYDGLYKLDHAIAQAYLQKPLVEKE